MKLNFKKLSIALVLASSMFFVSACSWFSKPKPQPTITNYTFQQGSVVFEREESFSLSGTTLTLHMSDNTTKVINLADAMIKSMPDMTTTGTKTIVITYEGKDYTITFVVVDNQTDKYIQKLNDFLNKFNAGQKNVGSFEAYASAILTAGFLGDEQSIAENGEFTITPQEILEILNSLEVSGTTDAYNILVKALVNASLTRNGSEVINLQNLTSQLNPAAFIGAIVSNVGASNLDDFVIKHVLKAYKSELQQMVYQLPYMIFPDLGESSQRAMGVAIFDAFYYPTIYKVNINYAALYDDMIDIINADSDMYESLKTLYVSVLTSFKNDQHLNSFSNLIVDMTSFTHYDAMVEETYYDYYFDEYYTYYYYSCVEHEDETTEQTELRENYMEELAGAIRVMEELYKTDFNNSLNSLIGHLTQLVEYENIMSEWEFVLADEYMPYVELLIALESVKAIADKDFDAFDETYGFSYMLAFQMADALYDEDMYSAPFEDVVEELAETIHNALDDIISGNGFDIVELLEGLQATLENLDIQVLIDNLNEYNSPMYFTYVLEVYLDEGFESEEEKEAFYEQFEPMFNLLHELDLLITFENNTVNFNVEKLAAIESALYDFLVFYEENMTELSNEEKEIFELALILVNSNYELAQRAMNAISAYKQETAMLLTYTIIEMFGMPESESVFNKVFDWSEGFVFEIINDLVSLETSFSELFDIVDEYGSEPNKTIALATLAMAAFFSDAEIDYNELFAGIELPPQIESIDYNKLVAKLKSENTYKVFELGNVEVKTVLNSSGEIVREILTLTLNIDFDIMVTKTVGSINITLEINY